MTAIWPSSLPEAPLVGSYAETARMRKVSFESDTGPPIERPKGTIRLGSVDMALHMTEEQLATFEDFVFNEIDQGSQPFYITHPRKLSQVKVKIVGDEPYKLDRMAPGNWRVSFSLLVIG